MSYSRFTKIIIDYFMSKDQSILRRNKMFWHTARDDTMFTSMRCISRHEDTQVYGTILSKDLTNQAMLESKAYKTYYAFASREKTLKPNNSSPCRDVAVLYAGGTTFGTSFELDSIGVSEISIFSEPTLCPSFLGLIDVPALKFKSSTNIKEFVRFILVKGHVSWTFVQHSGKLPSLLNSGLLSIVCCPIAMKLISAVVCTQPIGLSSYMGLIYVSSACAILPVNM
ncbi:hypothetical protein Tco_0242996 [Tanacetum coccineum]